MADQPTTPQRRGSWTKVVIFVSLYVLLLESLIEWVLVTYLFVNRQVDSKMLPSLVLVLIAVSSPRYTCHDYKLIMVVGGAVSFHRTTCGSA